MFALAHLSMSGLDLSLFEYLISSLNLVQTNGSHKTTFGIFEILKIEILTNFIPLR